MQEEIEAEKEKYQKVCSEKEDLETTVKNVLISKEMTEERFNTAQIEIKQLKTQKYWEEDYIEHLKQDISKNKEHEKELLEEKVVLEASIEELKRNQEALESAQNEAQFEIEHMTSKLQSADDRILLLEDSVRTYTTRYEKACIENSELKTSNEELKKLIESNGFEMKQLQADFSQTRVALRSTQSRCEADIKKLTMRLRNAEQLAEDMKKKVEAEVKEKEKLTEELQNSDLIRKTVSSMACAQQIELMTTAIGLKEKLNSSIKQVTLMKKKLEKTETALETAELLNEKLSDDLKKSKAEKKESDKKWVTAQDKLLDDLKNRNLRIAKVCHEAIQYHKKMNSLKEDFKKSGENAKEEMKKMMKKYEEQGKLLAELQRKKEQKDAERMELENEGYDVSQF
ncbi:hypothetical protein CAEBREN_25326 [Caenorhabditis brenneri]|uniref:Uncharacterized protein n=1 Tax=Caenorhabditis brenneri TaxID=135651 RepID=G0PLR5_CAEBE|nr:hypothetical protein CAEBREN_25326 [Caenorhabditis brenneri]